MQFSHQREKKERSGVSEEIEDDSLFPPTKNSTNKSLSLKSGYFPTYTGLICGPRSCYE